jgi:hypothetical protein
MKVNFNIKRRIIVNGKEYASVEDMPPELREAYEKAVGSGTGVSIEKPQVKLTTKIVFNGKAYENLDSMPVEVRQLYQSVMKSVETGEASPELLSAALGEDSTQTRRGATSHTSIGLPKPIEPGSSFSPRWIIVAVALLGLVFMLYYLFVG